MKARDYEIVEERFNINVNLFGYENKVFPRYVSRKFNEQVLNVLLISNEENHTIFLLKIFIINIKKSTKKIILYGMFTKRYY